MYFYSFKLKCVTWLTNRSDIDEADDKTETGDAEYQQPLPHIRQMIAENAEYRATQRRRASSAKNEQHDEEQNGE